MKRKHEEGYALVYSLVVLLVLSAVAMAIMAFAGRDLKAQQASIDRMKAQYAAQGELEKIVAQLEHATSESELNAICNAFDTPEESMDSAQQNDVTGSDEFVVTIHLEHPAAKYMVTIDCGLSLTLGDSGSDVEYSSYSISCEKLPNPANGGGG